MADRPHRCRHRKTILCPLQAPLTRSQQFVQRPHGVHRSLYQPRRHYLPCPNAYFRAVPVASQSPGPQASEPAGGPNSGRATVRRRNASAASSGTAHSALRRMISKGTPYWDRSLSSLERQQQTYHSDAMRIARGTTCHEVPVPWSYQTLPVP